MTQTPLELEILKTEKLRTTILAFFFFALSLMWIIFISYAPQQYYQYYGKTSVIIFPGYFAVVGIYFLLMRQVIYHYMLYKKNLPILLRYFNTFIEMSIPTVALLIIDNFQRSAYVLVMPPILIYFIFIFLTSLTLNIRLCFFAGLIAAFQYLGLSYYILHYTDTSRIVYYLTGWFSYAARGALLLVGGIVTGFVTAQIKQQFNAAFDAQQARNEIEHIFGMHVSPEVVSKLLSKNSNASEYIPVCIMFLDIRNFTHFAEETEPTVVVQNLNKLFKYMVEIIHENKGIINKFLGDGFMAIFGAPTSSGNDVENAVNAALKIIQRTEEEIKKGNIPDFKLGIGVHYGNAITGTIGAKNRLEYTVVGDVVNSAAHIEQSNKTYNTNLLISEEAFNKLSNIQAELVGDVMLKHRDHPIKLYKLV
ncbi:adenylate cyclase [Legionella steigerwaltii]|uniref:Adenylate cyclase n=1 Tax=Legionella steigerwaltii TaxID=460 RepID=A0A378L7Y1_9GAMM|nr:adenylate/guanylate cyclase domain-containing protein [Legionella steigerwaltii]KTD77232.1 adenylate cyclase [Legionella steigerwaltii]STY21958.1 adenylate cyclase [Legionella steigerwaltii]